MMNMHSQTTETSVERRNNGRLRTLFDPAYAMIEPFLDCRLGWAGSTLQHVVFRVLHENFSELTGEQVHQLVVAAYRAYIERNPGFGDHLPRPSELRHPPVLVPVHAGALCN